MVALDPVVREGTRKALAHARRRVGLRLSRQITQGHPHVLAVMEAGERQRGGLEALDEHGERELVDNGSGRAGHAAILARRTRPRNGPGRV